MRYMEITKGRVDIKNLELGTKRAQNMSLKKRDMVTGHQQEHMTPERGHWEELHLTMGSKSRENGTSHLLQKNVTKFHLEPEATPGIQFRPSIRQTCPLVEIGHIPKPLHTCENICCLHPRKVLALIQFSPIPAFSASKRKSNSAICVSW